MGHIRRNRAVDALGETVAMVWADTGKQRVSRMPHMGIFEAAVRETLKQHGFGLEIFYQDPELNPGQIERILYSRGIRGLILAPLMRKLEIQLDWNWNTFSVVVAGSAEWQPEFNRVRFNHFADMGMLIQKLREEGKCRMGLEIYPILEDLTQHAIKGGFLASVPMSVRKVDAVFSYHHEDRKALQRWLEAYQPDSLIVCSSHLLEWIRELPSPPPVYLRTLENIRGTPHPPGIRQDYQQLGIMAAEQLLSQLQLNQVGVPSVPKQTLITGEWYPGEASGLV
jgi:DNA-binding LacI/PurR family transcriptional regulator